MIQYDKLLNMQGYKNKIANPYPDPLSISGIAHYHFKRYQDEIFKMVSQQYRAWSDCPDMLAGLAIYFWQRLITLGSSRVRSNTEFA